MSWEKRLNDVVEFHLSSAFEWGVSDCYQIPDDAVKAMTGKRLFDDIEYSNEIGAAKALRSHGFKDVKEAFASKFEEIHPSVAGRGDIGVTPSDGSFAGGVFTQLGFMTKGPDGVKFLPFTEVKHAFKVV